jgi:hypothetical protein
MSSTNSRRPCRPTSGLQFVDDLRRGQLRPGLRIKRVKSHTGVWEMTWADDGRATFQYGEEVVPGHPHIIWPRIGTHDILDNP